MLGKRSIRAASQRRPTNRVPKGAPFLGVAVAAFAAVLPLAGCGLPATNVERDWNETMARYNMVGLYPINEDLQPGAILRHLPSEVGPQPALRRIGSLSVKDLRAALGNQERGRLRVQIGSPLAPRPQSNRDAAPPAATPTSITTTASAPGSATVTTNTTVRPAAPAPAAGRTRQPPPSNPPQPLGHEVLAADGGFGTEPALPRMRRLSMPAIAAARITEAQIAGGGPFGLVALAGALGLRNQVAVWVRLRDAELLGLDEASAYAIMDNARLPWSREHLRPEFLLSLVAANAPSVAQRICAGDEPPADRAVIRVVNRVLYAHSIEYEFARNSSVAGRAAAEVSQTLANRALLPASVGAAPTAPPAGASPSGGTGGGLGSAAADLAALQQALAGSMPTRPGVTTSLGIGTFGNAAITETSRQPLAVAYVPLVNYTVRGSLFATEQNEQAADRQLERLRAVCREVLDSRRQQRLYVAADDALPGQPRERTPIEQLVCENTRDLQRQHNTPELVARHGSLVVPPSCSASEVAQSTRRTPREALTPVPVTPKSSGFFGR